MSEKKTPAPNAPGTPRPVPSSHQKKGKTGGYVPPPPHKPITPSKKGR